jgi:hypothetical protein
MIIDCQSEQPAAHRSPLVSDLRKNGGTRSSRHDPRLNELQRLLPYYRRSLHQRRHHGGDAIDPGRPVQGLPAIAVRHSPWWRCCALSLGTLSRPRAGIEEAALTRTLNVFFDTCVYHQSGIDLLTEVIPVENILFASEMIGAVRGIDPETEHNYGHQTLHRSDRELVLPRSPCTRPMRGGFILGLTRALKAGTEKASSNARLTASIARN